MRVLIMPADATGCGQYRLMLAGNHLASLGHDVIVLNPLSEAGKSGFAVHMVGDEAVDIKLPVDGVDVLVVQRLAHKMHQQTVPLMRKKGIAVVVDMDDNLSCIHPQNIAYAQYHPRSPSDFSYKVAEQICRDATYVTVTTPALLKTYAPHGRGQVLDNYVPEMYLDMMPVRTNLEPVFGWPGNTISHPTDLLACGRSVEQLVNEGFHFKTVGGADGVQKQLRLANYPDTTGPVQMGMYPYAIASNLDVGIAPLEISEFNRGKSRLKPLELNALGVTYVASPRDAYRAYHKASGGGLLADTPKEWYTNIKKLMVDEGYRKELAAQGRAYAETQTIERNSWRWLEAWTRAYEIQRSGQ